MTQHSIVANNVTLPITDGGMLATTINSNVGMSTISGITVTDILDEYEMNKITVDHKVTEMELMKLREVAPDFANEIKENIAKNLAREISQKISYTKKHDTNSDVHHFIGRVWVFTEEELKNILGKR